MVNSNAQQRTLWILQAIYVDRLLGSTEEQQAIQNLILKIFIFCLQNLFAAMDIIKNNSCFTFLVLLCCLSGNVHLSLGADTINANQSLSGDQTIMSAGQAFKLGFFTPGKSSKYYIGMWYNKVSVQTIVWVANREKPVFDRFSSSLRISSGNLVLFNESGIPIWSTNLNSTTLSSVEAVLLDSGNLVLRDGSKSLEPLWQSFDYPTDSLLSGAKVGYNKLTKKSQILTSWKNSEDPASGLFSLELDPNGSNAYFILWNRSELSWTSGPWNGRFFSLVPRMNSPRILNFSFIDNKNESYFIFSSGNASTISRLVMSVAGQVQQHLWREGSTEWSVFWSQPEQCEGFDTCGAFGSCNRMAMPFCNCLTGFVEQSVSDWNLGDYSGGCVRKTNLQCGNISLANAKRDRFLVSPSVTLPKHQQTVNTRSAAECESICLNNCSCTAYAYDNDGCSIWTRDLLSVQQLPPDDNSGKTLYIKLAASEFKSQNNNKETVIGIAVGSVAGVLLLGLVVIAFLWSRKRRIRIGKTVEGSLVAFEYKDLLNVTKNFSEKLGGGGFGSVYKGTLPDSTFVAVKKLESINQGEKQFRSEVSIIGAIQHVNLIRLRGFCSEGTKKLVVYDYMPNGSLDSHLFKQKSENVFNWKTRYQIAVGTAKGLSYLHDKCRECIIHCDIKPENVLLDAEFCPKVADFGLAKLVGRDFSRVLTTLRGTLGYLAPEWISGVAITAKVDVYSYGMMLFELVSGRRNCEHSEDGEVNFFPTQAGSLITKGGDVLSLLDPRLEGNADAEEVTRVCRVAYWCIQDDEIHRPSMGQVVQILEGVLEVKVPPIPRFLRLFADNQEQITFFTKSSSSQGSRF